MTYCKAQRKFLTFPVIPLSRKKATFIISDHTVCVCVCVDIEIATVFP